MKYEDEHYSIEKRLRDKEAENEEIRREFEEYKRHVEPQIEKLRYDNDKLLVLRTKEQEIVSELKNQEKLKQRLRETLEELSACKTELHNVMYSLKIAEDERDKAKMLAEETTEINEKLMNRLNWYTNG